MSNHLWALHTQLFLWWKGPRLRLRGLHLLDPVFGVQSLMPGESLWELAFEIKFRTQEVRHDYVIPRHEHEVRVRRLRADEELLACGL